MVGGLRMLLYSSVVRWWRTRQAVKGDVLSAANSCAEETGECTDK